MLAKLSSSNIDITSSINDDISDIVELVNQNVNPAAGVIIIPDLSFKNYQVKSQAIAQVSEKLINITTQFTIFKNNSKIKQASYKSNFTLDSVTIESVYSAVIESWKDNFFNRAINFMDVLCLLYHRYRIRLYLIMSLS